MVNATGAWVDFTNGRLKGQVKDRETNKTSFVGGTKGSHLIVKNQELFDAIGDKMVYYENQEGRICILFRYFNNVLIGSTDLKVDNPDNVRCEEDEQNYILESLKYVFPKLEITVDQILYRFSGVRPLVNSVSSVTGQISREHYCEIAPKSDTTPFPIVSLIGGKWTTFRAFGEQAADHVLELLGLERNVSTINMAIGGGKSHPKQNGGVENWVIEHANKLEITEDRMRVLLNRYGTGSLAIANTIINEKNDAPLHYHTDFSVGEIKHIVRHESVESLGDIMFRRTSLAISGEINLPLIDEILDILGQEKSWDDAKISQERTELLGRLSQFHGLSEADLSNRQIS